MAKIRFTRSVLTSTVGQVHPGDTADVIADDAERYIRAGWAEPVTPPRKKPAKKAADK